MALGWSGEPLRAFAGCGGDRRAGGRLQVAAVQGRGAGAAFRRERIDAVAVEMPVRADEAAGQAAALLGELCRRANLLRTQLEACGVLVAGAGADFAAELAARTGVTVVAEFAAADLAAGGRGTALGALSDALALCAAQPSLLLHLGRAARATALPGLRQPLDKTAAFDAAPCGALLDALAEGLTQGRLPRDLGGARAVQGQICAPLLAAWLDEPFFRRPLPRFLAEADFDARGAVARAQACGADAAAGLRTAVELVARSVAAGLAAAGWDDRRGVAVAGGARRNGMLVKRLGELLPHARLTVSDELGYPADAPRAVQAALLAYCLTEGVPANLPALTGARAPRLLGVAHPGAPDHWRGWLDATADNLDRRAAA